MLLTYMVLQSVHNKTDRVEKGHLRLWRLNFLSSHLILLALENLVNMQLSEETKVR
jgi:hypothetical protein